MYTADRDQFRNTFCQAWLKYQQGMALEPLELQIVQVIELHPELQIFLTPEHQATEFDPADNPFLHMGLHLAIREQLSTDRPTGIKTVYLNLIAQHLDAHQIEHLFMQTLQTLLNQAHATGQAPDEKIYLDMLRDL